MRLSGSLVVCVVALCSFICGCGAEPDAPQGPEMGSVQAYLDAHPEALEDEEVVSEEEEFAATEEE